jgi:hypothetical protein
LENPQKDELLKKCETIRKLLLKRELRRKEEVSQKLDLLLTPPPMETTDINPEYIKARAKFMRSIIEKGGKCSECGLDLVLNFFAADFHHLNPELKTSEISKILDRSWESIKKELEGCILLCSNCHRKEHSILRRSQHLMGEIMKTAEAIK